jgi:hypothetical protein
MEDDLKFLKNGRQPKQILNWNLFWKTEDDLNPRQMEGD